jgi:dissimilatory sulfite reductase (desulfoviridin) alpha/beta subunit
MSDSHGSGILRIIDNKNILNLKTLVSDLERNHGKGKVSFVQQKSAVMIAIKTDNLVELAEVCTQMGFTVSEQGKG